MRTLFLVFALLLAPAAHASDPVDITITLADGRVVDASPALLAPLKRQAVSATSHGKTFNYEGYDLRSVLSAAGLMSMDALHGKQLATYLTATAADGYVVVVGLTELDPTLGDALVLLVDRENGQPLPTSSGPWMLVVPSDKRAARWVRQLKTIQVVSAKDPG